ncbi:murein DD-endopeptidase MepM/ murein hydrolase activator NlpD [Sagittula marina]|uniref:Murein DD-endopeptidase MepM/ murein hydrolase activator NlpD n=1 Tax=Sagittula marina TaxID=943940 RepID=A0A7W6DMK8_9RHOB|nr:M23 family metallopeptidase [Sagittula marina]MBB3985522.1 murein DD-endopeptidase MepM/ murein hydrolase activator NlpD [Sagittula marina]
MTTHTPSWARPISALALLTALGACAGDGLDLDMRGRMGGPMDTSAAAATAVADRPAPDDRGVLSYPSYQVAVAKRDDTVARLADRVGLPAQELARYNGLQTGDTLRRGEIVALPRRVAEPSTSTGLSRAPAVDVATLAGNAIERAQPTTPTRTSSGTGVEPVRHQVARGETAFTIARLYNVTPRSLAEWNGLDKEFTVREGQFLLIPTSTASASASSTTTVSQPGATSSTPIPPSSATPLPEVDAEPLERAAPAAPAASSTAAADKPKPKPAKPAEPVADIGQSQAKASGEMAMPVSGAIIREYKAGVNPGVDIAASPGQPVGAAASGKVVHISEKTDGTLFMIVRHPNEVSSVYMNIADATVKNGDSVSRGQTIARVGPGSPSFLHFEVRKGLDATDPMAYLN